MIAHSFDLSEFFKINDFIQLSMPFRVNIGDVFDLEQMINTIEDEKLKNKLQKFIGNKNYSYIVKRCETYIDGDNDMDFAVFVYGDMVKWK